MLGLQKISPIHSFCRGRRSLLLALRVSGNRLAKPGSVFVSNVNKNVSKDVSGNNKNKIITLMTAYLKKAKICIIVHEAHQIYH